MVQITIPAPEKDLATETICSVISKSMASMGEVKGTLVRSYNSVRKLDPS